MCYNNTMKKIAVVVNEGREKAVKISKVIASALEKEGVEVVPAKEADHDVQAVIAIGGDGTIIEAIRFAKEKDIPILGVNAGRVGFLAVVEEEDAAEKVLQFVKGEEGKDYHLQERVGILADLMSGGNLVRSDYVVNDVVVKGLSSVVTVGVSVGGTHRVKFRGDGVLVSTTTGSTAYNLSAGGPIAAPGVKCFFVTSICPQGLPVPTILVPETEVTELKNIEGEEAFLSVDGSKGITLKEGDVVKLRKSHYYRMVLFNKDHFYEALEKKFNLSNHNIAVRSYDKN